MSSQESLKDFYENFPLFVGLVWKYIGLPRPTAVQLDIAKTLQNLPNNRFILEGFRGVAKSFITCAYSVWRLWRDPQIKIMIVSANKERADANAVFIKKIIIITVKFIWIHGKTVMSVIDYTSCVIFVK